jgi:hypothetical protein
VVPGSAEAGPLWLGQNPARKLKVLQSIFQGICRILLQAQKQMIERQMDYPLYQ